jgi:hypothetical protein
MLPLAMCANRQPEPILMDGEELPTERIHSVCSSAHCINARLRGWVQSRGHIGMVKGINATSNQGNTKIEGEWMFEVDWGSGVGAHRSHHRRNRLLDHSH